jgi:uncharacterized protein (TIGR04255 family)
LATASLPATPRCDITLALMADAQTDTPQFQPLHKGHAIEQVVYALQFHGPISDQGLTRINEAIPSDKEHLPLKSQIHTATISFGSNMPVSMAQQSPISGYVLSKANSAGATETELRIDRASIIFRTTRYTDWKSIWGIAQRYFDLAIPHYVGSSAIASIALSYVDKFVWEGAPEGRNAVGLLRAGSVYLAPHVFTAPDLWHCHTGKFLPLPVANAKRLVNVNVDFLDEPIPEGTRRAIAIRTVLNDLFEQPGPEAVVEGGVAAAATVARVAEHMTQLHDLDKNILRDILCDQMVRRVGLDS